ERIFDQIHAVEFNFEDAYRSAEVGSLLSSGLGSDSFERISDDETESDGMVREGRQMQEAHVAGFVDDIDTDVLAGSRFERISDDEESEAAVTAARRGRKATSSAPGSKKKSPRSSGATKSASKRKTSSKRSKKAAAEETPEGYGDAEAAVGESHS